MACILQTTADTGCKLPEQRWARLRDILPMHVTGVPAGQAANPATLRASSRFQLLSGALSLSSQLPESCIAHPARKQGCSRAETGCAHAAMTR